MSGDSWLELIDEPLSVRVDDVVSVCDAPAPDARGDSGSVTAAKETPRISPEDGELVASFPPLSLICLLLLRAA